MSFSIKNAPASGNSITDKIQKWEKAKNCAVEAWLADLCMKLPDQADHLLAWLIGAHYRTTQNGAHVIEIENGHRLGLVEQFLFAKVPKSLIAKALGGEVEFKAIRSYR